MAPPRKHDTDEILDAARTVALRDGPRATSVAAIAHESGAPAGTLYHRFRNRDGVLQATWLRALGRFHDEVLAAADHPDPVEAGVAVAAAAVRFARRWPDDARLLVVVRRTDLLDGGADPGFEQHLAAMNAPVEETVASDRARPRPHRRPGTGGRHRGGRRPAGRRHPPARPRRPEGPVLARRVDRHDRPPPPHDPHLRAPAG